jgi:hypothetical protein
MRLKEKPTAAAATSRLTRQVQTISPTDVFTLATLTETLGVRVNTLPREIRKRRLRAAKRGGRYYILGEWVIEWLRAGEVRSKPRDQAPANVAS